MGPGGIGCHLTKAAELFANHEGIETGKQALQHIDGIWTGDYTHSPPVKVFRRSDMPAPAPASTVAVGLRYAEQAVSNTLYGAQ